MFRRYMKSVFWTLLYIQHLPSVIGITQSANYNEDKTRANYVFGNPLFYHEASSLSKCLAGCSIVLGCYGVSLDEDNVCQGYKRFADPSANAGTRVWKKAIRCHPQYIYNKILDLCWKWYGSLTWEGGKAFCSEEDSRLIVIDTSDKLTYLRQHIHGTNDYGYYWVGGEFVLGRWLWLDGTPVDMTSIFWGPGEPNGNPSIHDCMGWQLSSGFHGKFDDTMRNSAVNKYICEKNMN